MKHPKDLTGLFFGGLEVIKPAGRDRNYNPMWECLCGCGQTKLVRRCNLIGGHTKSCGCMTKQKQSEAMKRIRAEKAAAKKNQPVKYYGANLDDALDSLGDLS